MLCGLRQVFEQEPDFSILEVCNDSVSVLDAIRRHQPSIGIIDLDRSSTFKLLRRLQRHAVSTRVVVLASASDQSEMLNAVRVGASAVIPKELVPGEFVARIRKVHAGAQPLGMLASARLLPELTKVGPSTRRAVRHLTPRETEIARLAVLGVPTRIIADRLSVKQGTVKIHLHSIYDKLNVGGRLGLVLFARRHGLA
jgi:DNA-binding NarL/FixJ family response regulator